MKGWPLIPLGQISRPRQWPTPSSTEFGATGFPVYGANGRIGFLDRFTHEQPTVVIGCRGSCGSIHVTEPRSYVTGNAMALDDLDGDRIDVQFLAQFLAHRKFADVTTGTSQPQITGQNIITVRVPVPPLHEQRRIAAILNKADALRTKRRAALAQLDALPQSIFLDMFGDPITNERGYPVRRLIDLVDQKRPISYGILMPGPDQQQGVKYVRVVDMKDGAIDLRMIRKTTPHISNAYRRSLLRTGDLLLSIRGHVGRLAHVPHELDGANITQDTARLAVSEALSVFVRECLRTLSFQRWMAKHTKGVAVRGINLGDVKLMPIPTPSQVEVRAFVVRARAAERLGQAGRLALEKLDALFASLQHRAFRGEL